MTGKKAEGFISQASLISYLKPYLRKNGLFRSEEYSSFNKQFELLSDFFNAVHDTFPSDWGNPDSILSKTSGINAFFRLLRDLVELIEQKGVKPDYKQFRAELESLRDIPMEVDKHKLYGTGGAIAFCELLKQQLGFQNQ